MRLSYPTSCELVMRSEPPALAGGSSTESLVDTRPTLLTPVDLVPDRAPASPIHYQLFRILPGGHIEPERRPLQFFRLSQQSPCAQRHGG